MVTAARRHIHPFSGTSAAAGWPGANDTQNASAGTCVPSNRQQLSCHAPWESRVSTPKVYCACQPTCNGDGIVAHAIHHPLSKRRPAGVSLAGPQPHYVVWGHLVRRQRLGATALRYRSWHGHMGWWQRTVGDSLWRQRLGAAALQEWGWCVVCRCGGLARHGCDPATGGKHRPTHIQRQPTSSPPASHPPCC